LSKESIETLGHWLELNNKTKDGYLLANVDMDYVYDKIQIVTKCDKRSMVILIDVTTYDVKDFKG